MSPHYCVLEHIPEGWGVEEETKMRGNTVSHMPCKLKCLLAFNIWVSCEDNTDTKIQTYRNVIFLFFIALLNVYSFKKKKEKKKGNSSRFDRWGSWFGWEGEGKPFKAKAFCVLSWGWHRQIRQGPSHLINAGGSLSSCVLVPLAGLGSRCQSLSGAQERRHVRMRADCEVDEENWMRIWRSRLEGILGQREARLISSPFHIWENDQVRDGSRSPSKSPVAKSITQKWLKVRQSD